MVIFWEEQFYCRIDQRYLRGHIGDDDEEEGVGLGARHEAF